MNQTIPAVLPLRLILTFGLAALAAGLAGCHWPTDDNAPDPPPVTRVLAFHADPATPVIGDTVRLYAAVEHERDLRLQFIWTDGSGSTFYPDGRRDGPRVKVVVPNVPVFEGNVTITRPEDPGTRTITYRFEVPVRPKAARGAASDE